MTKIQFENGTIVEFEGDPTPEDIDFVAKQEGITGSAASSAQPITRAHYAMAGPLARGVEALQKGISTKDVPFIANEVVGGATGGVSKFLESNPIAGPLEKGMEIGSGKHGPMDLSIKPSTDEGKKLGGELGTIASFAPMIEGLQAILKPTSAKLATTSLAKATSKAPEFAEKVRDAFYDLPRQFGEKFGSKVDELEKLNPSQNVSIGSELNELVAAAKENSDVARRIGMGIKHTGDQVLQKTWDNLINNRFFKSEWTLEESQKFIQAVKKSPGMAGKLSKMGSRFDANELPLLDFYGSVRARQVEAFPEFAKTLGDYAQKMRSWSQLKNNFKFGGTINKIKTAFGDAEVEKAVKDVLPADIVKEIGGVRNATKVLGASKVAAKSTAGVAGLFGIGKALGIGKD